MLNSNPPSIVGRKLDRVVQLFLAGDSRDDRRRPDRVLKTPAVPTEQELYFPTERELFAITHGR